MSGRLRILPHKSWHVWTTENIEKVKRDERLHREELEQAKKKSRDLIAENLLARLLSKDKDKDSRGSAEEDVEEVQSDAEAAGAAEQESTVPIKDIRINRDAGNREYLKEKQEKELLQKRLEGSAPYQLVPDEYTKHTPWYMVKKPHIINGSAYQDNGVPVAVSDAQNMNNMNANNIINSLLHPTASSLQSNHAKEANHNQVVTSRGKRLQGQAADMYLDRDSNRKESADPMAQFLHKSTSFFSSTSSSSSSSSSSAATPTTSCQGYSGITDPHDKRIDSIRKRKIEPDEHNHHHNYSKKHSSSANDNSDSKHQRKKKFKDKKHKKHRKDDHRKSSTQNSNCNDNHNHGSGSSSCSNSVSGVLDASMIHILRQKRLDRERDAQLKADLFIAQRE